jgi:hypothetical protein
MEGRNITTLNLLAACAEPSALPLEEGALARLRQFFLESDRIPITAETHGLAPLLYVHARQASLAVDPAVKRALQALYLRHRRASQTRSQVLAEILTAFREESIDVLVLKGAALAHIVYAEPALRPMRDMDLLVREKDAVRAQQVLIESGFNAGQPSTISDRHKHLPAVTRRIQDMTISVEVHHDLNEPYMGRRKADFEHLWDRKIAFDVGGVIAYAMGPDDMLIHLCQHGTYLLEPLKLIWCADVIGVVNRYVEEIDWEWFTKSMSWVLPTVAMFGCLVPPSPEVQKLVVLDGAPQPEGIGDDFDGWPRVYWQRLRARGLLESLRVTFLPSEWWLRLYYGVPLDHPILWTRWVRHPLLVLTWPARVLPVMRDWPIPPWYRKIFWRQ